MIYIKYFLIVMIPLDNTIQTRREIPRLSLGDGLCRFTLSQPRSWRLIEKLVRPQSRRWVLGIKSPVRRGWMHGVGGFLCSRKRERNNRMEIIMAPVSQAIKRYWSSLPLGRSNLQRLVRNENDVIPRLMHPALIILHVRETSIFRESATIDFIKSADENAIGSKCRKWEVYNLKIFFLIIEIVILHHAMKTNYFEIQIYYVIQLHYIISTLHYIIRLYTHTNKMKNFFDVSFTSDHMSIIISLSLWSLSLLNY